MILMNERLREATPTDGCICRFEQDGETLKRECAHHRIIREQRDRAFAVLRDAEDFLYQAGLYTHDRHIGRLSIEKARSIGRARAAHEGNK